MAKVLGSNNPVITELDKFAKGLGFDFIPIDEGSESGQIGIATDVLIEGPDFTTQNPVGTDNPIQVLFGPAIVTPDVELGADGALTFNVIDDWDITYRLNMGRVTSAGVAYLFLRSLLNGVGGTSVEADLDDGGFSIPLEFQFSFRSAVNDVLAIQMYRDSAGIDNGGLRSRAATLAGWEDSPSAKVLVRRSVVNTEPNPAVLAFVF